MQPKVERNFKAHRVLIDCPLLPEEHVVHLVSLIRMGGDKVRGGNG